MGTGKAHSLHETDFTRSNTKAHKFDEILEKVTAAGGTILKDEEVPLFIDVGLQEAEIGLERVVEFNLNKTDFQLTRKIENFRLAGEGKHKSLIPVDPPFIKMILKTKPEISDTWTAVDFDEMF